MNLALLGIGALEGQLWQLMFVMVRVGAALVAAPIFGARSVPVQVGLRGGRWAVLRGGLDPGAVVVLHPDGALRDGARVARR